MPKKVTRRQHVRVEPDLVHKLRVDVNGDDFIDILFAKDISLGGLAVNVSHGFKGCAIDGLMHLIVSLPEPKPSLLNIKGRILYLSDCVFGIQFIDLGEQEELSLKRYICLRLKADSLWRAFLYRLGVID